MSPSKNLAVAALAGLLSSTFMAAGIASANEHGEKAEKPAKTQDAKSAKEKHACKGQNSCKGNSPDGKNECKGKSECSTLDKK